MDLIFLESLYKEKLWGSETWLVSAHKNGDTKIQSGEYKGKFLSEVYDNFPLLIKIIDAKDDLSIQVHPNDEYAEKYENSKGKTECWYVLDCKDDASLIIGHNAKDKIELKDMVQKGKWDALLREVKIKKGDFFQIEPGTIHAIKGGVKLLEIQQSSDITYRLYDYDRLENGKPRELHTKESIENIICPFEEKVCNNFGGELVSCMYYTVEKLTVAENKVLKGKNQIVIASCIKGEGYADGEKIEFGTSFIIPPFHETLLQGDMEFIISYEKRENVKIGIDLGGTNIAVGLVDRFNRLIDKISSPTKSERGVDAIVSDIVLLCNTIAEKNNLSIKDIASVGIGCPGTIDAESGVVVYSNNIRMDNVPLRDMLEEKLNIKVNIENDANAAAFGEYITNFKDVKSFVLMTLGTGVGSGLVIDGKLYRGFNGAGFECGHMVIHPGGEKCTCGSLGCLEAYASASALQKRGKDSCENIFALAHKGSGKYQKVLDDYITDLSLGIGNVINIIQPQVLAIGGGVSNAGDELLAPLKEKVKDMDFNKHLSKTEIVTAKLKNDAGIIGAALI